MLKRQKRMLSILLIILGFIIWIFPNFYVALGINSGEGHIIAVLFLLGGLILYFMPEK